MIDEIILVLGNTCVYICICLYIFQACSQALVILFGAIKNLQSVEQSFSRMWSLSHKLISIFPHKASDSFHTENEWAFGGTPTEMPSIH